MSRSSNTRTTAVVVAAALLAGVAGWQVWVHWSAPNGPDRRPVSADRAQRLIALKNRGLGELEDGRFDKAATLFEQIVEELPGEPLGHRNLAVARVLQFKALSLEGMRQDPAQAAKLRQQASDAVQAAIEAEPESAVPQVLAARLHGQLAEVDFDADEEHRKREIAALEAAAERSPDAAHVWYALFEARELQRTNADPSAKAAALKRAYELLPGNLAVLQQWLKYQQRAKDPAIVETLETARPLLRPIAARMCVEHARNDLMKMLDEAIAGVKRKDPKDWAAAGFLANILNARHATKLDRREVQPHELEFVITNFSSDFYQRADLPEAETPPAIAVKLTPARGPLQLPPLKDVRAIKLMDFDVDGRDDVIALHGKRVQVFGYDTPGKRWKVIAESELQFEPAAVVAADLDFDFVKSNASDPKQPGAKPKPAKKEKNVEPDRCATADVDLVVWGSGGVVTLRNERNAKTGKRNLVPVKQPEGFEKLKGCLAVAVADFDHDSDLDLIVSTAAGIRLWANRGDMTFEDFTEFSWLPKPDFRASVLVPIDFNRDVHIDVVLGGPNGKPAGYLQNVRHGQLRFKEFGEKFAAMKNARALCPIDADGNASWDWIAAGADGIALTLTRSVDNGRYQFLDSRTLDKSAVDGATLWDYDNDGCQDVLAWSKGGFTVYRGGPRGEFRKTDGLFEPAAKNVTAADVADVDGDGDLDVVANVSGTLTLYLNEGGNANNWIDVELHAQSADVKNAEQRCNTHGVGSLIELKAGESYQARVVTGPVTHFGLGKRKRADVIRVLWTNGIPQNELQTSSRQSICSRQKLLKGSCPYLYTWDGRRFVFHTDLLWAAPIGLQFADGVPGPSRPEEFLKIPGDKLAAIDGEYRVQITEELWEAGYFDSVKLYAIDHPAEVEIYSNEKVGPAAIARPKVHVVRHRRLPVAARDQAGRDVLPLIARRDDVYLQAYNSRLTQGLTPEHFLELDLGKLKDPKRITLYLAGWVFPSDTSINVWLSHHPHHPAPQPPSVWVPDKDGKWKQTIAYMGFPGGKTKTIAVDLSKAFLTDDYRVRIKTTMELRWDAAFFTVNEGMETYPLQELKLKDARLYYRGFSRRDDRPNNAPETYDFHDVDTGPRWPPMNGRFTRYGDVTPIVRSDDDRLVVMGAGDTMTLRFAVPDKPLPPGWTRDFFIRNVGWDKDADLNTVLGQSSEPLPFRGMKAYPFPPDDSPPDSPEYRDYLRRYQTRRQPAGRFWRGIWNFSPPKR